MLFRFFFFAPCNVSPVYTWYASLPRFEFCSVRPSGDRHGNTFEAFPSDRERLTAMTRALRDERVIFRNSQCPFTRSYKHARVFFLFFFPTRLSFPSFLFSVRTNERTGLEPQRKEQKNINTGTGSVKSVAWVSPTVETEGTSKGATVTQFSVQVQLHGDRAASHVSKIESRRNGSSLVSRSANAVLPLTT